jgi:excisionase family DNA binding protein
MAMFNDKLLSIAETSERLGVSSFTTRRLIKARQLRGVRIAKRLLVPESEVMRVIAEGCGNRTKRGDSTRLQPKVGPFDPLRDWPDAVSSKDDQNKLQRKGNEDDRQGAQLQPQQ